MADEGDSKSASRLRAPIRNFNEVAKVFDQLAVDKFQHPSNFQKTVQNASKSISADVAEWQTQATQNRSGNHVGSSPTIGTMASVLTAFERL